MDVLSSVQSKTLGRWDLEGSFLLCMQTEGGRQDRKNNRVRGEGAER